MQTFLPYKDFLKSAKILDKKRCWKQVIETKQIINCLEGKKVGWGNHPAVKMWVGYTDALKEYFNAFLQVCLEDHEINTKYDFFDFPSSSRFKIKYPWWLGNEDFHKAMRARLIEKDKDFYLSKFPNDEGFNNGKYFWPVIETKTFRII